MYRMRPFGSLGQQTATFSAPVLEQAAARYMPDQQQPVYTMATAPADTTTSEAPSCLTPEMVQLAVPCFTGQIPPGYDANAFNVMCSRAKASGIMDLPLCPDYPLPAIPTCLDATQEELVSYCKQYGASGDDGAKNAVCWAALKDPAYFEQFASVPVCGGEPPAEEEKKAAMGGVVMWGGLALLAVVGGGVIYYFAKR